MKERITWIDWIKTVGIIIVIYCHVPQAVHPSSLVLRVMQALQMPLMFLLSGMLYKPMPVLSMPDLKATAIKYVRQLLIPLLIFWVIGFPHYLLKEIIEGDGQPIYTYLIQYVIDLTQLMVHSPMWYVAALLEMKILMDLLCDLSHSPRATASALTVLSIVGLYSLQDTYIAPFNTTNVLTYLPCFAIGFLGKDLLFKLGRQRTAVHCAYVLVPLAVCCAGVMYKDVVSDLFPQDVHRLASTLTTLASGLFGSVAVMAVCMIIGRPNRIVEEAARGTIVTLGIHFMMIVSINLVLKRLLGIEGEIIYPTLVAFAIATLIEGLCWAVLPLFRKYCPAALGGR